MERQAVMHKLNKSVAKLEQECGVLSVKLEKMENEVKDLIRKK